MLKPNLIVQVAFVCASALLLGACEQSVAGACTSAQDAALKVSILSDELSLAETRGSLDSFRLGELGAKVIEAGSKFGAKGNHQSYCTAIEKIRSEAGLH